MTTMLKQWSDRLLGRGDAAVTIPILDGAMKPNQRLERAPVLAEFAAPTDIATDGHDLYLADDNAIIRIDSAGSRHTVLSVSGPITAIAALSRGVLAVAINGCEIQIIAGDKVVQILSEVDGRVFRSVNALTIDRAGQLLATEGSAEHGVDQWQRDLMCHGRTGRVLGFDLQGDGRGRTLASGLRWPFGVQAEGDGYRYSESWRHQVVSVQGGKASTLLDNLPGYPARLTAAASGGAWLTVLACRSQLVEFVLREPVMCRRMVAEIDPDYWIAPAFSSGNSFLEPLQGGSVKQMGMIKPWAPARSYGLVVRLDERGRPLYSLHSRVGGLNHGAVAAAECHGALYVLVRGPRRLLKLDLDTVTQEFE
jgi:hypothetical protein